MEAGKAEGKRQEIKKRVNYVLEPLMVDLLIAKPSNPYQFMREWLEERRELYQQCPIPQASNVYSKQSQMKM